MQQTGPNFTSDHPVNSREWMDELLRTRCKVATLHPHQLELAMHINRGKEVFCVSGTGTGKTVIFQAGPIAAQARGEKGIALMIVPTKVLVEQQADVASSRGLRGLAINQDTVRDARLAGRDLFKELAEGDDVRMGVMTPHMLMEADMRALLRKPEFTNLVRWFPIDEVHLVEQDGVFKAGYSSLVNMRVRLPSSTIWIAGTATAPPKHAISIAKALGFRDGDYINARYSVDRPNLKYIPRTYQHPTSNGEFMDLSFVVPFGLRAAVEIIPSILFADFIKRGNEIMKYLDPLIPPHIPDRERLIQTYNSLMPFDQRKQLIEDFKSGIVRVLIVTDTASYGFDVPNIRRAILTDVAGSFSDHHQKLGRAGRDGLPAVVIAFAPPWVLEPPSGASTASAAQIAEAERRSKLPKPLVRWFNPTAGMCPRGISMEHDGEAFVCRPGCCSPICDPNGSDADLAEVARWERFFIAKQASTGAARLRSDGTFRALEKPMKESLEQMLDRWRHRKWAEIRVCLEEPCEYFLPRQVMNAIVNKAHVCTSLDKLKTIATNWDYADSHGEQLFEYLTAALTGFNQIFKDRVVDEAPSSDSEGDETSAAAGIEMLEKTTANVLRSFCRELDLPSTGAKAFLVDRLAENYIS
ncbi:P-loop containing nucleoside triphosphate hydrolase protein [Mycena vitilis]|nr:P-loop containing nucleoside triphosphate hydrolase protein [Mycena vitilis]